MKKIFLAATMVVFGFSAASAADLAARPYTKAPPSTPVFAWTGFYIGGNVGWGRSHSDFDAGLTPGNFFTPSIGYLAVLGDGSASKDGFTGGGQIGYNWQFAPNWVVGIEADINALSHTASISAAGFTPGGTTITSFGNSLESQWIATVRPRVGYAFDRSLIYVTGGLAILGSKYTQTFISDFPSNAVNSSSKATAGWTIGGGWEYALSNNWSVKGEYLYAEFTGINVSGPVVAGGTNILMGNAKVDVQTAKLGVNYKFGGPVVAKY